MFLICFRVFFQYTPPIPFVKKKYEIYSLTFPLSV